MKRALFQKLNEQYLNTYHDELQYINELITSRRFKELRNIRFDIEEGVINWTNLTDIQAKYILNKVKAATYEFYSGISTGKIDLLKLNNNFRDITGYTYYICRYIMYNNSALTKHGTRVLKMLKHESDKKIQSKGTLIRRVKFMISKVSESADYSFANKHNVALHFAESMDAEDVVCCFDPEAEYRQKL